MGTFFYDPYTEFDFGNLGFPDEISVMVNRMVREYRENDKLLFIKTKFQQSTGLQLLKFNSPTNINTVIMVSKRLMSIVSISAMWKLSLRLINSLRITTSQNLVRRS